VRGGAAPRWGLAGLVLALGCALVPSAATAAPAFGPSVGFHLKRGRYEIDVGNLGQSVVLTVETGALESLKHVAATSYVAHGTATESRLQASFGQFGELSMRFHPSPNRPWVKPGRNCSGLGRFLVRHGVWEGTLRFRGEDDYLSLDLRRVRGTVETIAPQCRQPSREGRSRSLIRPSPEPPLGREVPVLQARWRHGVRAAEFLGGSGREGSNFFAATQEARGRVAIFRAARAEGKTKAVTADHALTEARLSPPSPFHGSARYRAAADGSKTWAGSLFASFPGAPHYALTGEPFAPSLELFPELLVGLIGIFSADESRPHLPCSGRQCPQLPLTWPK
jgi:hypothetical protein